MRIGLVCAVAVVLTAPVSGQSRGWVDLSIVSVQPAQGQQDYRLERTVFGELGRIESSYPALPRRTGVELGGGVGVAKGLGVGIMATRAKTFYAGSVRVSMPHPFFFNRFATDMGASETITRTDTRLDLSAVYLVPSRPAWRVRVFGGPSRLSVTEGLIGRVTWMQKADVLDNRLNITSVTTETVTGSAWGWHAGGDVAYFPSRYVGVGGGVRLSNGSVSVTEPLTAAPTDLDAGSVMVGAGLRFRF